MDLWGKEVPVTEKKPKPLKKEHPMDILIKDDKRTKRLAKKKWKKQKKCKHTWKEMDKGRVHKRSGGVSHQWFLCSICKKKQKRNL